MIFLSLLSLHQGLALGAAGLLICAISEVGPAVKAVRSRFSKLSSSSRKSSHTLLDASRGAEGGKDNEADVQLQVEARPALTRTRSFKKAPSGPPVSTGPILSIKSIRRAADFAMVDPAVAGDVVLESDEESWVSDDGRTDSSYETDDSDFSSDDGSDRDDGPIKPLSASASIRKSLHVVAAGARRHAPAWGHTDNPVMTVLVLVIGFLQLAFFTLSSGAYAAKARRMLPRRKHQATITSGRRGAVEGDEML